VTIGRAFFKAFLVLFDLSEELPQIAIGLTPNSFGHVLRASALNETGEQ